MLKVYKSRIDLWMKLILVVSFAAMAGVLVKSYNEGELLPFLIAFLIVFILPFLVFPAKYTFYDDYFTVQSGIIKLRYFYNNIKDVRPSNNPFSLSLISAVQFAFSLKAVHVTFKKGKFSLLISPRNRDEFIEELKIRSRTSSGL